MKLIPVLLAIAAIVEIGAAGYYLAEQPAGSAHLLTVAVHCVAAIVCAAAGSTQVGTQRRSRSAWFVFCAVPALLLPVGGVLTVWVLSMILRSTARAPQKETASIEKIPPPPLARATTLVIEPIAVAMRTFPLDQLRSLASGLRNVRPVRSAAALLGHLQQHQDTETSFRAQGAVALATRPAEERLKHPINDADSNSLTERQRCEIADASLELAEWTQATGANRKTLLEQAAASLSGTGSGIPQLARVARTQLASGSIGGAEATVEKLQAAGASRQLSGELEAELLFRKRDWKKLADHCATLDSASPEIMAVACFWRAAPGLEGTKS